MSKIPLFLIILPAMAGSTSAFCGDESLQEMQRRCEEARAEKITPLRAEAIEDCVSAPRSSRTREDCERMNSDFGEGGGMVEGGFRPRMFMDLPACVEYLDARDGQVGGGSRR